MSQISLRLKELRRRRQMSQEELAKKLGISRQAIIALEQGTSLPSLAVTMAILREMNIPFPDLFESSLPPVRFFKSDGKPNYFNELMEQRTSQNIPLCVAESHSHFYLEAMLPGVQENDVTIDLSTQHVMILAVRKSRIPDDVRSKLNENSYGPIMRILSLESPINPDQSSAEFHNGMLTLILPKMIPTIKRRITFKKEKS